MDSELIANGESIKNESHNELVKSNKSHNEIVKSDRAIGHKKSRRRKNKIIITHDIK